MYLRVWQSASSSSVAARGGTSVSLRVAEAANRRIPARRLLGMAGPGVVLFRNRIGQKCGFHRCFGLDRD